MDQHHYLSSVARLTAQSHASDSRCNGLRIEAGSTLTDWRADASEGRSLGIFENLFLVEEGSRLEEKASSWMYLEGNEACPCCSCLVERCL